ncbi:hypothetical protein EPO15_03905 [bacterium]|nr:MAG: hypothetical protein EPO15_03905 [bacterium]
MRLALIAALLASAPAQAGPVVTAALGRSALPLPPGMLFAPTLSSYSTPRFALTPTPLALRATLPSVPTLTPTLPRVALPAVAAVAAPTAVAAQTPVRAALAATVASIADAKPSQRPAAASAAASALFDGLKSRGAVNAIRTPDWSEDRRINAAIALLNRSEIGRDLYAQVYRNHQDLRIEVDDRPGANYDARLVVEAGRKTLYLTESLVDRQSPEVVAAYLAREMSDLYFESFPASAERGYMAYSNMTRVFADLSGSGKARDGYWWNRAKDQYTDGAYAMERYYGSWREAVQQDYAGTRRLRDSAFFNFLKGRDDSNAEGRSKMSLREQYDRGLISYSTYREMDQYFSTIVNSEVNWLNGSGRW